MDADLKKILKAVVLEMRHELEGYYDNAGHWHSGDLETRLAEIGVRKDRTSVPVDELGRLTEEDVRARKIVDAFIEVREQSGVDRADAVAEYIRESAYTWANRLVALRCMEARDLLNDEVIIGREAYGGRSLVHHRLTRTSPELCTGEDDGRFAMLTQVFAERATTLPMLFDPDSPSIALRPSPAALKNCLAWLSGTQNVRSQEPASDAVFAAPDALGWAYQYWNTEEKDRVFEAVRSQKGTKIEGADIIPATQLYTEDYMVKFLVQNSLGATWMGMHPESKLSEGWEYYVCDADRAPAKKKPLQKVSLLDPACGSGHFLIEAFDMFYAMYEEEGGLKAPEAICKSILENNLFGIDIDERAVQIAEASLWMKAEERAFGFSGANTNLVAATSSHLKGESWERFLTTFENEPHIPRVLREFARSIEHIDEFGSLARPYEALEEIIKAEHETWEKQERDRLDGGNFLFQELRDDVLATLLPFQDISDKEFFERTMRHALFAIDGFTKDARESGEFNDQLMGAEAKTGFRLLELLSFKYDVVIANPPYMGQRKQGSTLSKFLGQSYPDSSEDLYSAFLDRALSLLLPTGRFSFVTMFGYTCLPPFAKFRKKLLSESSLEILAHVGTYAFKEMRDHVNGFLTIGALGSQLNSEICILDCQNARIKEAALSHPRSLFFVRQKKFESLPNCSFAYWFDDSLLESYERHPPVESQYSVSLGLSAVDNSRLYRRVWEVQCDSENIWYPLNKGGRYDRWSGPITWAARWVCSGANIKALMTKKYPYLNGNYNWKIHDPEKYFIGGVCYTNASSWGMGARDMPQGTLFEDTAPGIIAIGLNGQAVMAMLNCAAFAVYAKLVNPSVHLQPGDVRMIPLPILPQRQTEDLAFLASLCKCLKSKLIAINNVSGVRDKSIFENAVGMHSLQHWCSSAIASELQLSCCLAILDGIANLIASECYVGRGSISLLLEQIELPIGWIGLHDQPFENEIIRGVLDATDFEKLQEIVAQLDLESVTFCERNGTCYDSGKLDRLLNGEDSFRSTKSRSEDEEAVGMIQWAFQSDIDKFSRELNCSPVVVCEGLLARLEGQSNYFVSRSKELAVNLLSYFAISVMECWRAGGTNASQLKGSSENRSGIVPIISTLGEGIANRVLRCFVDTGEQLNREFHSILNMSLEDWFSREFFDLHVATHAKRPIAWHLQSANSTTRKSPAFSCLIYYLSIDGDTIAKILSQYTNPLRLRYETELRGISATIPSQRSDRQARRAVELEEWIAEIQQFDSKLTSVALKGFGPDGLSSTLRQYAFEEAMLAMKARWLAKLSEFLQVSGEGLSGSNESGWVHRLFKLNAFTLNAIHPSLGTWITESLEQLTHHCSEIGPKAPNVTQTVVDPTAEEFAKLIQSHAQEMVAKTVALACDFWFGKFAEAELQPRKEEIKVLKSEQKILKEEIKRLKERRKKGGAAADSEDHEPFALQQSSIDGQLSPISPADRVKQLTAEIKRLEQELNEIEAAAHVIRKSITDWSSDEPLKWGDWLAAGPMFDQISSLDERRAPPKTIAEFIAQESLYAPDINDGVRVNIAPLQKAGLLAAEVLAAKDVDKAIADRAEWRADERRWVREGKLPQPGWWAHAKAGNSATDVVSSIQNVEIVQPKLAAPGRLRPDKMDDTVYSLTVLKEMVLQHPDGIEPIQLAQAFTLLAAKDQLFDALKSYVTRYDNASASQWHKTFNQQPDANFLKEYFKDLHSRQFAEYKHGKFFPGVAAETSNNGWTRFDASLALAAVESMPNSLREEILEPKVKDMVITLRLVG